MAKQVSKTVIGGFVISAIFLLIAGVVLFGGGKFFKKTNRYVLFFDASVTGLSVGAPVVFRGVEIGTVASVAIHADVDNFRADIPVVIEVEPDRFTFTGGTQLSRDPFERTTQMIDHGIRGQLAVESLVTGQLMVLIDFFPDTPANLRHLRSDYPELPTIPSDFEQLANKLKKLPVEEIFAKLQSAIESVEKILSAPELGEIIVNLKNASANMNTLMQGADRVLAHLDAQVDPLSTGVQSAVGDARKLLNDVDRQIEPLSSGLQSAIGDARKLMTDADREIVSLSAEAKEALIAAETTLDSATRTLNQYGGLVDEKSPLMGNLNTTLAELARSTRAIRAFFEYLEQHPEALIQGKGTAGGN